MPKPAAPFFHRPECGTSAEQRLTGQAMRTWLAHQRSAVPGFEANSLMIADPGGQARLIDIAEPIATMFGLWPGQNLADTPPGQPGFVAELRDACDLLALGGRPVPFETHVAQPPGQPIIVRGIALPLLGHGGGEERAQIVLSWRQLLGRSAGQRLRRELGAALQSLSPVSHPAPKRADPFARWPE